MDRFDKTITECRSPIQDASLDNFRARIGRLFSPKSVLKFPFRLLSHSGS